MVNPEEGTFQSLGESGESSGGGLGELWELGFCVNLLADTFC